MNGNIEELITALYDMIQDAKALPLGADKCIIERDKALDMLDEVSAQLPGELKQARAIVQSREQRVSQARGEAASIIQEAQARAAQMVESDSIYQQVLAKSREEAEKANQRINELKAVGNAYMDQSLGETEAVVANALEEIRRTRARFQAAVSQESSNNNNSFDQPLN